MTIDTSIYGNIRPSQLDLPSPLDNAQKAMTLSALSMQQQEVQRKLQAQNAQRAIYAQHMDQNGNLKPEGLAALMQLDPQLGRDERLQGIKFTEENAKAQAAHVEMLHKTATITVPYYQQILNLDMADPNAAAATWPKIHQELAAQGVPNMDKVPDFWGPETRSMIQRGYVAASNFKEQIDNQKTAAETGRIGVENQKTQADIGRIGIENKKTLADIGRIGFENKKTVADTGKSYAETDKIRSEINSPKAQFGNLPVENQEQIKKFAEKNASKMGIATQIDSTVRMLEDPQISEEQKLLQARQMIKVLNSTEGQDAVGAEEAKRLAGLLDFKKFNLTEPGPFFGRAPIADFAEQAKLTSRGLKDAAQTNQGIIAQLKGGAPLQVDVPSVGSIVPKKAGSAGGLQEANAAAPAIKPGAVEDGYVYMGGDPGNPKSWKRAK